MKALFVALTLVIGSTAFATSFQTHEEYAIQEFNKSSDVKQAREAVKQNMAANLVKAPKAVMINGLCGFAGCSRTYLVTQVLERNGTNASSDSIVAIVSIPPQGKAVVSKVVDSGSLLFSLKK